MEMNKTKTKYMIEKVWTEEEFEGKKCELR